VAASRFTPRVAAVNQDRIRIGAC